MQRAASELCLLESKPGIHFGESAPGGKDEHVLFPSSTRSSSIPSCCLYPRTSLLAFSIMTGVTPRLSSPSMSDFMTSHECQPHPVDGS